MSKEVFRAVYIDAWERYLNSFVGVNLPPWVEMALMTGTIAINAVRREEAKQKLQRFKEWIAGKIYVFRNRKKQEIIRRQTRLRVRKFYGIVIISEESKFDIPNDYPLSKYWRRESEMRRDVDAACTRFWVVRYIV